MRSCFSFLRKTDGLTTIEWVGLCAVVIVAALAISQAIVGSAGNLGGAVATQMDTAADDVDGN